MELRPSKPGYDFNVADLRRAEVSQQSAANIILSAQQSGAPASSPDGMAALLAAILKQQRPRNASYAPFPFNYDIWRQQQVLTKNENRAYLLIQNVGMGDLMLVFEEAPNTVQDFSAIDDQQTLVIKQTRAIRIIAGGSYEPSIPPTNSITIFTLNTATNGLVVEG